MASMKHLKNVHTSKVNRNISCKRPTVDRQPGVCVYSGQKMEGYRLPKSINRKIGRAMHDFGMLEDGDRVVVAVSGGIDSMVTAWLLQSWKKKAPIDYELMAVHIDNGFGQPNSPVSGPVELIQQQLDYFSIPLVILAALPEDAGIEKTCFICARNRRKQLFDFVRLHGGTKLALGHHKDDLIETFFINVLYGGNISTMVPRQELFSGKLSIIRPLAYIEKKDIKSIADRTGIIPVKNLCPLAGDTRRDKLRDILDDIYNEIPDAKGSIFSALGNVRDGYML